MTYVSNKPDSHYQALCGPLLSTKGAHRKVYEALNDPDVVIKETKRTFPYANMLEWIIWSQVKGTTLNALFAECLAISETGKYLVMERVKPITPSDYANIPKIPVWWTDPKPDGIGISSSGAYKILDYGMLQLGDTLSAAPREWWSLTVAHADPFELAKRKE